MLRFGEKGSLPSAEKSSSPRKGGKAMKAGWVDFKTIKDRVSVEQVLAHYGINWLRRSGDELRGKCPIHPNAEGERTFHVNLAKNLFHCFSCGGSGRLVKKPRGCLEWGTFQVKAQCRDVWSCRFDRLPASWSRMPGARSITASQSTNCRLDSRRQRCFIISMPRSRLIGAGEW